MTFIQHLDSPLGTILLAADDVGLTGLWFEEQKYFAATLPAEVQTKETPALRKGKHWLDLYFAGKEPKTPPPLHLIGTPFRLSVWKILSEIPYGKQRPTETLRKDLPKSAAFHAYPPAPSEAPSEEIPSPSSSPATAS